MMCMKKTLKRCKRLLKGQPLLLMIAIQVRKMMKIVPMMQMKRHVKELMRLLMLNAFLNLKSMLNLLQVIVMKQLEFLYMNSLLQGRMKLIKFFLFLK